jgi:3-isopropylmalate dehydratase small subunit
MIIEGRAVVVRGDNIDTDVLYPGALMNIDDPALMKPHLFEGLDPSIRDELGGGETILVVDRNFGSGSSREHVPHAMKAWGIRCVVGRSFARIFLRNCINLGLPAITCSEAVGAASAGATVTVDTEGGSVSVDGTPFAATAIPPFMHEILDAGGLVRWAERKLERPTTIPIKGAAE